MVINILTVGIGTVLSFLAAAAAAMLLYRLSDRWSEAKLGAFARYAISPVMGILVGVCVGFLAKSPPGIHGSLKPSTLGSWLLFLSRTKRVALPGAHVRGCGMHITQCLPGGRGISNTVAASSCNYGLIDGTD
jgi:hypothetical protein